MAAKIIQTLTLLLIHCLMYLGIFVGVLCWSLFYYASLCVLSMCKHIDEEENDSCFALIVFLMSCECSAALPHDAVGLSAVVSVVLTYFLLIWCPAFIMNVSFVALF